MRKYKYTMEENKFAYNLKEFRLERGIGQVELAKSIGVSKGIISLWENGKREPTLHYVILLAHYFDVSVDTLIGYEN